MLGREEQNLIQHQIDVADHDERKQLRLDAEGHLKHTAVLIRLDMFDKLARHESELAVETLMRLEATEQGKGWWFRTKRRVQIAAKYWPS